MKKVALILCFLFSVSLFSQSDFRKGFIIKNNGERVNGFVNYKENLSVYEYFNFKKSIDSKSKKYTPSLAKAYGFDNGKIFFSKKFTKKNDEIGERFFEMIISGPTTLYKFSRAYYIEKNGLFKLLDNEIIQFTQNSKKYKRPSRKYIPILKIILNDCQDIKDIVDKTKYSERSLSKLIKYYNSCKGQISIEHKKSKQWFSSSIGISLGIDNSNSKIIHESFNAIYFTKSYNPSISLTYGIFAELSSPRFSERISFYTGVFFTSHNFYKKNESKYVDQNHSNEVTTIIKQIKIPIGFRYTFPKKTFTPYFTLGVNNYKNINSFTDWTLEIEENNVVTTARKHFDFDKSSFGYFASVGVKKNITKKILGFIDLVYESHSSTSNRKIITEEYDNVLGGLGGTKGIKKYKSNTSSLQVLIGIRF